MFIFRKENWVKDNSGVYRQFHVFITLQSLFTGLKLTCKNIQTQSIDSIKKFRPVHSTSVHYSKLNLFLFDNRYSVCHIIDSFDHCNIKFRIIFTLECYIIFLPTSPLAYDCRYNSHSYENREKSWDMFDPFLL